MKLLVIGGSGLLGSVLIDHASHRHEIFATYNKNVILNDNINSTQIELLDDRHKITSLIDLIKPEIVIHTAAHPSVDLCEKDHTIANRLHVDVTEDIAISCKKNHSKLIYISTDAVFEGQINKKYVVFNKFCLN